MASREQEFLRDEKIEPFLRGKGPVFRLQTWLTGKTDQHPLRRGYPLLGYRLSVKEPKGKWEVVFEGEDYSPSPGADIEGDGTLNDILAFFTSDTWEEEDDPRTTLGREIAQKYADDLSLAFEEREENSRRKNGQARFNVTLGKEHVDVVYFSEKMTADQVKRSLVDHDGYDPRITVKKMEQRRTGVPPEAYLENRLPSAPRKRFEGRFAPPAQRETSASRLRHLVKKHEEEERPFEPEKRGSWRGGAHELVVNPSKFHDELKKLVLEEWRLTTAELEEAEAALKEGGRPDLVMRKLNGILDTHGVEAIPPSGMDTKYLYLNTGDTYNATVLYSYDEDKYFVSDWGTVVEEYEPEAERAAWSDWLEREVTRELKREIEGQSSLSEAETEKILDKVDEFDSDEFYDRFYEIVRDVGGQFTHESDGSIFVYRQREAVQDLASELLGERKPNNSNAPLGGQGFVDVLRGALPEAMQNRLFVSLPSRTDQLFVAYYNIPSPAGRDGAEKMNNRLLFTVTGFGRGPDEPPPTGKIKIEHTTAEGLDRLGAERIVPRLRGKTGAPAAIARYLAEYIERVAREVPPKHTHSRAPNRRR